MKTRRILSIILALCMLASMLPSFAVSAADDEVIGLKEAFKGYFKIGTALSANEFNKAEVQALTLKHFNSVTCENEMKPDSTLDQAACQSIGNNVNTQVKLPTGARNTLAFCEKNHIPMRGHVIAWHSQTPSWFFRENFDNSGAYVTPEIMNQRLESFIKNLFELIAHDYPDLEIYAWDMCNEAFTDSNPATMRDANNSNWIHVYGDNTFIYKAFEYGQKYKPEGCMLCYNDYNEYDDGKLAAISALCKDLYEKGLLDAIGMQSHLTVGNPTIEKYQKALDTYASIGCPIMITELDVQARNGNIEEQTEYYTQLFETYCDYKDSIEAVVFWGTQDSASWRPNGNPLLFANGYQPKDVFYSVIDTAADHDHVWREEVTAPTCTERGYTTKICTVEGCGRTIVGSYVDALGHKWDDGKVTKPATTTEKGVMTFTCTVCGDTKTKSIPRIGAKVPDSIDFTDPACLDDIELVNKTSAAVKEGQGLYLVSTMDGFEPANGRLSGDAAINPKDLVLVPAEGDWVATMKFAFNQGGSQGYSEFCGFYAYDDANNCVGIRGGDGAMQDFIRKDGTVTAETKNYSPGLKSGSLFWYRIEKEGDNYTCSISTDGESFTEMFKFENTGIEGETIAIDAYSGMATGYNYTIESLVFEEGDTPIPTCEHDYQATVTAPTCTAVGYTTYTCSKCGDSYVGDEVAALGHDYKVVTNEPTCTEAGSVVYICAKCGDKYTEEGAPALDHDFKDGKCTRCGEKDPDYKEDPLAKFTDLKGVDWALDGIRYCVENGLMKGMTDTTFGPQRNLTRGQFVTILYRVAKSPETKFEEKFEDVEAGRFYSEAVVWAANNGYVKGINEKEFDPDGDITREQIAAILYRYAAPSEIKGDLEAFPDKDKVSNYARVAMAWAVEEGIINGVKTTSGNVLAPKDNATRAQIATIFMRWQKDSEE